MSVQCPKCGYTRTPTDRAPDYECPSCGVVYKKYEAFLRRSAEKAETNATAAETMALGELQQPENAAEPLKSVETPQFHDESFSDREYGRLIPQRRAPVAHWDTGPKQVDSGLVGSISGTAEEHLISEGLHDPDYDSKDVDHVSESELPEDSAGAKYNKNTLQDILIPYIGRSIAINLTNPEKLEKVTLMNASDQFFTVGWDSSKLTHIPYSQVLSITEAGQGASLKSGILFGVEAPIFVEIFHMLIYKKGTSYGFGVITPLGN